MTELATSFDWANMPADVVRAFARALEGGRPDTERALEVLRRHYPLPDADFFRDFEVRYVAANAWLGSDPAALDHVYGELQGRVLPATPQPLSPRGRRSAVRRVIDPPEGSRQSQPVRDVLAGALLAAGGRLEERDADATLRPFNVIATRGFHALTLHPHQERVVADLRQAYLENGNRMVGVVVMPTGAGKTVTAVSWLLDDPVRRGVKVLWVTHRQELLDQTAQAFVRCAAVLADGRDRFTLRLIGAGFGSATTLPDPGHDVAVATIGALARNPRAVRGFLAAHPCVVVFDEAHHAVASTWREVLQLAREETDDAVLGLTATPTRMGHDERRLLGRLFERMISEVTLTELVPAGYIAEARVQSVPTHVDAEALADADDLEHLMHYGELSARMGRALAENAPRNRVIIETYLRGPQTAADNGYGQTIVFAVDVGHCHILARDFALAGISAGALTASISTLYRRDNGRATHVDVPRAELLTRFRDGEFAVLVNVQVLTEGVDVPSVKSAFLARPTGSEVLMSQMVGRALRGEKVGGTPHAYLVSFRDHWEQFPDWMDPIRLPGIAEAPTPSATTPTPGPTIAIEIEEWRGRLLAAAQEIKERIPAGAGEPWTAVPVALYSFEVEVPVDDEWSDEGELDARHVDLYVHEHDASGFEALHAAVESADTVLDAAEWLERFFTETPAPLPPKSRLELLARYVAAEGKMPAFITLEGRDAVDPRRIAKRLYRADARRDERDTAIRAAYATNRSLVDAFYGGEEGLRRQVLEQLFQLEAGIPQSFHELRVPRLRGSDRIDHSFGEGAHDLAAILDRVRNDPRLFPDGVPRPAGGIAWTARAYGSFWADYRWSIDEPDADPPRIRVNVLLDSKGVEREVIEFLVYHELLHHQDILGGKVHPQSGTPYSPHDRDFCKREERHPAIVRANAWIDSFHDRLAAVDARGRPVRA